MKKLDIGKSFKNKYFKYGGYSTLLTAIVLVIVLVVNLIVGQLNIKLDMTKNKLFSLSEQSYKVMDSLNKDVTINIFYKSGNENEGISQIIDKYKKYSKKITVKYIDPVLNPQIASKYSGNGINISEGSIVVESGNKFKVINGYDLYNINQNPMTGESSVESLAVEQKVTGAIMYVVNSKNSVAYVLQGHNEKSLPEEITKQMDTQNVPIKNINILTDEWKPEAHDILIISSPEKDLSSEELDKLKNYFNKGGRGIFLMDYSTMDMPNYSNLLSMFGVETDKAIVLEGDAKHSLQQSPVYIVPVLNNQTITDPINSAKLPILFPGAQPIKELKVKKSSIKIEPLLTTTDKSWAKKNVNSTSAEKEQGDLIGPFNIAVAITDTLDGSTSSKVVVFSSSAFINPQFISATPANADLFMNSVNWIQDSKNNISIAPKDLTLERLNISTMQQLAYSGLVVIVIPAIAIIAGIVVWVRRRHL